jgi:hypothetical protein
LADSSHDLGADLGAGEDHEELDQAFDDLHVAAFARMRR